MASMEAMRAYVSRQYKGSWPEKVRRMPDRQVTAIYFSMQRELDKAKKHPVDPKITETEVRGGLQLSLFENSRSKRIKEEYIV